jgi:hypothetical protein
MNDMTDKKVTATLINLTPPQLKWLQEQKRAKGISQSRIIRRMLNLAQRNRTTLDKIFEQALYD